jgi:hypothetical protein
MTDDNGAVPGRNTPNYNSRGAVVRLFGVILIILGTLNTMLSWRGGFEVLSLPVVFIAVGLLLCLIGAILRGRGS